MRRKADRLLKEWRDKADRKPLLVKGVRQCGKTYLLRTYAQTLFESVVYVNLENDKSARADFSGGLDPYSIVRAIEARTGQRIVPGKTLLFIDEVQACEEALTSLKYFCEDAPEYYVAAAGSLLGVAINHQSYSFPVGKTDLIEMAPLDFEEFLWAMGYERLADEIRSAFESMDPLAPSLHDKALGLYRQYLVVGGMPEAVQTYAEVQSVIDVAEKHRIILDGYSADTNKYADERLEPRKRARVSTPFHSSLPKRIVNSNTRWYERGATRPSLGTLSIGWCCRALWCAAASSGKSKVPWRHSLTPRLLKTIRRIPDCSFPKPVLSELIFSPASAAHSWAHLPKTTLPSSFRPLAIRCIIGLATIVQKSTLS